MDRSGDSIQAFGEENLCVFILLTSMCMCLIGVVISL